MDYPCGKFGDCSIMRTLDRRRWTLYSRDSRPPEKLLLLVYYNTQPHFILGENQSDETDKTTTRSAGLNTVTGGRSVQQNLLTNGMHYDTEDQSVHHDPQP